MIKEEVPAKDIKQFLIHAVVNGGVCLEGSSPVVLPVLCALYKANSGLVATVTLLLKRDAKERRLSISGLNDCARRSLTCRAGRAGLAPEVKIVVSHYKRL